MVTLWVKLGALWALCLTQRAPRGIEWTASRMDRSFVDSKLNLFQNKVS
jgi:hypothetical protein